MDITESDVKVIVGECIDKALHRYKEGTCDEKHKEVSDVKSDIREIKEKQESLSECVRIKFNKMYLLLFGALITLVINLIYAVVKK